MDNLPLKVCHLHDLWKAICSKEIMPSIILHTNAACITHFLVILVVGYYYSGKPPNKNIRKKPY